jgi:hypothetical protein
MKRILITAMLCLALGSIGLAQQNDNDAPATVEDVENYMQVIHSHEIMQQMVDAMSKPMHKMVHDEYMKDKSKLPADFEARLDTMMDDMLKDMPFDEMMQASIPVYQKHFTKGDLGALTVFYSSPTGQKVLHEMPAIMADSMNAMMPIMQRQMEKVTQRVQDEMEAMLKESQKKPGQEPAATPATRN